MAKSNEKPSLFFVSVINAVLSNDRGWLAQALSFPALGFCGTVSYFVYLFHLPVNFLVHGFFRDDAPSIADTGGIVATALSLIVVGIAGWLSHRFFEGPILRWGRRFEFRHLGREPSSARNAWRACPQASPK